MLRSEVDTLGWLLKSKREELSEEKKGFSVRRVAEAVGISPSYLSRLEKGEYTAPSDEILRKLSSYLDLDFSKLAALSDGVPEELTKIIKSQNREFQEMLNKIESIPKKTWVSSPLKWMAWH